jgi:sRNA-binding protein
METPAAPCAGAREGDPISEVQLDGRTSNTPPVPRKQVFDRREHLLGLLKAVAPEVFCIPPVPLAVGIRRQVLDLAGEEFGWHDVAAVLRRWTSRHDYVIAVATGGQRLNLDGTSAGEVAPEHQRFAQTQVAACTGANP